MNTKEKFGLEKSKAILLFIQMILSIIVLITSIYLLVFTIVNKLSGWMIASYIFITVSIVAVILYALFGYNKGDFYYRLSVSPFLVAVLVNIILPGRDAFQVAVLAVLLAIVFGYLLMLNNEVYNIPLTLLMVFIALLFSVYSAFTANTQFLGEINASFATYLAMYLSIFIPTIMCGTFALISNVKRTRIKE